MEINYLQCHLKMGNLKTSFKMKMVLSLLVVVKLTMVNAIACTLELWMHTGGC